MLIGKSFNKRCEKILCTAAALSNHTQDISVSVVKLSEILDLDRVEIRHTFEYLIDLEMIRVESIGGPFLFGHISLTKKGLLKVKSLAG